MSFLVVLNRDGTPVEPGRRVLTSPEYGTRHVGAALVAPGLGTDAPDCVARNGIWLIGRVRLDGRQELRAVLDDSSSGDSDALLCLRAYERWGDRCLEHLSGDFCFVLWDEERQRLFCVRDQLGIRPLVYAASKTAIFVSDSIEAIAGESTVSRDLDDFWIADFLASGICVDLDRTVYKHIKRLPPAHYLIASAAGCDVRAYWQLSLENPIYYRKRGEYLDHFAQHLRLAINDRLPQDRVGISMSGGLDSSTLAAHTVSATGDASKVVAHTVHFENLFPDDEKHFASLVANKLGIDLTCRAVDDAWYDPDWYDRGLQTPEPNAEIVSAYPQRIIADEMAKHARVWFYGEGPDNALVFEWRAYLKWLLKGREWSRFGGAVAQYVQSKQLQEWWSSARHWSLRLTAAEPETQSELPVWLSESYVRENDLLGRAIQSRNSSSNAHPWHPRAFANLTSSLWPSFFERFDSTSGVELSWRHPYLDLRVLTFLLSVPPIPWARRKLLLREAMSGILPADVLRRDKAPLAGDPQAILLQRYGLPPLARTGPVARYVDCAKVPNAAPSESSTHPLINVHVLDFWLRTSRRDDTRSDTRRERAVPFTPDGVTSSATGA